MGKNSLQFWSVLWGVSLFLFGVNAEVIEEEEGEDIPSITKFVQERTKENLKAAIDGTSLFLAQTKGEKIAELVITQFNTLSMTAGKFYGQHHMQSEPAQVTPIGELVVLLRPYERQLAKGFLSLQKMYRESLLEHRFLFESVMLVEVKSIFYFFDGEHRPYLIEDQAKWLLSFIEEWNLEGGAFEPYVRRINTWKAKQDKQKDKKDVSPSPCEDSPPKRKWGNKGFHSYEGKACKGMVERLNRYNNKYTGHRPRSFSW